MKPKHFHIVTLLLFCSTVFSQKHNVVKTKMSNLLYIGVDNRVIVYKKTGDCQLSMQNGTITPIDTKANDSCTYNIRVDKSEGKPILTIKQGNEVMTYAFRKRHIPDPEFVLHATGTYTPVSGNTFPLGYFRNIKGIVLHLDNFDFDVSSIIKSFNITIISANGERKEFQCSAQDISKYTFMGEEGDVYIFHNIIISIVTSGEERILKDQVYQVKKS